MADSVNKYEVVSIAEVIELIDRALLALNEEYVDDQMCSAPPPPPQQTKVSKCDPNTSCEEEKDTYTESQCAPYTSCEPNKTLAINKSAEKFSNEASKITKKVESAEIVVVKKHASAKEIDEKTAAGNVAESSAELSVVQNPSSNVSQTSEPEIKPVIFETASPEVVSSQNIAAPVENFNYIYSASTLIDEPTKVSKDEGVRASDRIIDSAAMVFVAEDIVEFETAPIQRPAEEVALETAKKSSRYELPVASEKRIYEAGKNDIVTDDRMKNDDGHVSRGSSKKRSEHGTYVAFANEGSRPAATFTFGAEHCLGSDGNINGTANILADSFAALMGAVPPVLKGSVLVDIASTQRNKFENVAGADNRRHADQDGSEKQREDRRNDGWEMAEELNEQLA